MSDEQRIGENLCVIFFFALASSGLGSNAFRSFTVDNDFTLKLETIILLLCQINDLLEAN